MALDVATIAGPVLGVLRLFGLTLLSNLTKRLWNILIRERQ
jgi:hypothetical protein